MFAATQQIASVAGLRATKVQVRTECFSLLPFAFDRRCAEYDALKRHRSSRLLLKKAIFSIVCLRDTFVPSLARSGFCSHNWRSKEALMVLIDQYWCIYDHFMDRVVPYLSLFARRRRRAGRGRIVVRSITVVRFPFLARAIFFVVDFLIFFGLVPPPSSFFSKIFTHQKPLLSSL